MLIPCTMLLNVCCLISLIGTNQYLEIFYTLQHRGIAKKEIIIKKKKKKKKSTKMISFFFMANKIKLPKCEVKSTFYKSYWVIPCRVWF